MIRCPEYVVEWLTTLFFCGNSVICECADRRICELEDQYEFTSAELRVMRDMARTWYNQAMHII
jgi:hypothetical protein